MKKAFTTLGFVLVLILLLFGLSLLKDYINRDKEESLNMELKTDSTINYRIDSLNYIIDSLKEVRLDTIKIREQEIITIKEILNQTETQDLKQFNEYLDKQ